MKIKLELTLFESLQLFWAADQMTDDVGYFLDGGCDLGLTKREAHAFLRARNKLHRAINVQRKSK